MCIRDRFSSFTESLFNFLVLQTTANYPDIMLPFYRKNRSAFLLFALYLFLQYFILANTIIAFFYYHYRSNLEMKTKRMMRHSVYAMYIQKKMNSRSGIDLTDSHKVSQLLDSDEEVVLSERDPLSRMNSARFDNLHDYKPPFILCKASLYIYLSHHARCSS
eukprot:TRINITY_DN8635_c0_g1_i1.p3 TRINITY_DN8635_c0_g1~~TRINITY_DN8635_c0_g1_i1.p3  ORF type:complete len:181 (+),score=40.59 TRINITY_DN8635_c0_g1_i1:60-545(+)